MADRSPYADFLSKMDPRQIRIYQLNMIKLHDMFPSMLLTHEERMVVRELLHAYFGDEPAPPLPWVLKSKLRALDPERLRKKKLREAAATANPATTEEK